MARTRNQEKEGREMAKMTYEELMVAMAAENELAESSMDDKVRRAARGRVIQIEDEICKRDGGATAYAQPK